MGSIKEIPTEMTAVSFCPDGLRNKETLRRKINCPECLM
jgi:hypothetical protein